MQKELKVRFSSKIPNAFEIYYEGGGELPECLSGGYTDIRKANEAIEEYKRFKSKESELKKEIKKAKEEVKKDDSGESK